MAVVKRYGSAAYDPDAGGSRAEIPAQRSKGKTTAIISRIDVLSGDSPNSQYFVGKIPSNSRFVRGEIKNDALTATGAGDYNLGSSAAPAALISGGNLTPAGSTSAILAMDIADQDKPAWQVLGFAADPVKDIDIILTLLDTTNANGEIVGVIEFTVP